MLVIISWFLIMQQPSSSLSGIYIMVVRCFYLILIFDIFVAGGLIIGALSDSGCLSPRRILLISSFGSAASYLLIAFGDVRGLIFSRILVGLVKQTMTVTTSMLAKHTSKEDRSRNMGRLSAASSKC